MPTPTTDMQAVLDAHAAMGPLPIETLSAEVARQIPLADRAAMAVVGHSAVKRAMTPAPTPVGSVEHRLIPGPDGGDLLVRVYTPDGDAPAGGWPVVVYYHGGGWVIATLDTYDASCRALCAGASAVIVSVAYRYAPEHPFPAAHDDALAAYRYVAANTALFGGETGRVAIAGESAGGNLALSTALAVRGDAAHAPRHVLAVYPVTDLVHGPASASAKENADAKPLNTPMLTWFYTYLAPRVQWGDPRLSVLHADLAGLPPVTLVQAEIDPLRSEGTAMAERLAAAGVPVEARVFEGVTHEFFGMAGVVGGATEAMAFACKRLSDALKR